jgi:LAO/AO transport system kinase
MGDSVQAAKAGILEVADVFVVNKADREGADQTARELRHMLSLGERRTPQSWRVPIVKTVASNGTGMDEVVDAVERHAAWMDESGELTRRRHARVADEIEAIAVATLRERMGDVHAAVALPKLAQRVLDGEIDPYAAADDLVEELTR